jgi:long-chain acyl-CoA synthetase
MNLEEIVESCATHSESVLTSMGPDGSTRKVTFGALRTMALDLAARLSRGGLAQGHVVGIQAENSIDWVVWDLAIAHLRAVLRPYPSHHEFEAGERIAAHSLALLVSDREVHRARPHVSPVEWDGFQPDMIDASAPRSIEPDLHSIVYSSGTTGREKVLLISRKGASAAVTWAYRDLDLGPQDRHLIFLPLTGIQQRNQVLTCLHVGADVILCAYQRTMPAIRAYKPTFLLGPPAIYENMLSVAESGGLSLSELFGGQVRFLVTGMAPIRPRVMAAYWDAGLKLLEGYGLTECGIIACNTGEHCKVGTVGRPIDPAGFSISPEGEILVRQRQPLSLGYLDADDLNAETFAPDGRVRTGDMGRLDEDGFLILDGRIKDMIILPSGKKLHPGDLEHMLLQLPGVEDAVAVDNGNGVTAVLNVAEGTSEQDIRKGLRGAGGSIDAASAVTQVIFADIPLSRNPIFATANLKLNRRLVGSHFLGGDKS